MKYYIIRKSRRLEISGENCNFVFKINLFSKKSKIEDMEGNVIAEITSSSRWFPAYSLITTDKSYPL